jgi:hypothetical protein
MFRKLAIGLLMAGTAVALSGATLAPNHEVRADPLCYQETISGDALYQNVGPLCVPYPYGNNCQTTQLGFGSLIDTKTYFCVPRP